MMLVGGAIAALGLAGVGLSFAWTAMSRSRRRSGERERIVGRYVRMDGATVLRGGLRWRTGLLLPNARLSPSSSGWLKAIGTGKTQHTKCW
jgi:hypothetical protein